MPDAALIESARSGSVAVLTLRHPPVNTLFRPLRTALLAAIDDAERDPGITALVITGERHFSAGAELAEFDSGEGLAEPTLHLTLTGRLDSSRLPSVAALTGAALGGGLELALACSARVAAPGATLGLPETTLGFMPGAGGTQRLPRAVGMAAAVDLITTGRSIDSARALDLRLIESIENDVVSSAVELAASLAAEPARRSRLRDVVLDPRSAGFADLALRDARRARAAAGVISALEALVASATEGFDRGLAIELGLFERLAATPEARAARYRFLSDRGGRVVDGALPDRVAVIGAGTMGRGIAQSALAAGFATTLIDTEQKRVDAGVAAIAASLDGAVAKGRLSATSRDEQVSRLRPHVGLAGAADAGLVIEAVFEDLDVKRSVFAELDQLAAPGAVLASNTSSLDLDAIAASTSRPESVVGMHFFSPVHVMRLVEVVDGSSTSAATLGTALAVASRMHKLPVVSGNGPGFIGNRIFDQYLRQAHALVATGVRPERIDAVLEAWGMAMGPFRVLDVIGNDVVQLARTARGETDPVWAIADRLADEGLLGRKTGAGWYRYEETPIPNPDLDAMLPPEDPGTPEADIVDRCILAMVVEAERVLADKVAAGPADIDTVLVHGYGFPAWRGGPWFWAGQRGWGDVVHTMGRFARETGDRFWRPGHGIRSLA